ncbi:hypothetical protein HII31_01781, partial [Pseudocercospora fuligena]
MVYNGKPSQGCEPCRRAKKRCSLERPVCRRCVKLGKKCGGYRDISVLQVRDHTPDVIKKFGGCSTHDPGSKGNTWNVPIPVETADHQSLTGAGFVGISCQSGTIELCGAAWAHEDSQPGSQNLQSALSSHNSSVEQRHQASISGHSKPHAKSCLPLHGLAIEPEDLAINCFVNSFALQNGHWDHISRLASHPVVNPCLTSAMKACGMTLLDNLHLIPNGKEWSRKMYGKALACLNSSLGDSKRSRRDESLIAVNLLSFYESVVLLTEWLQNLACDGKQSVHSWKAHIEGASQLLALRGKEQLASPIGRALFRETRAQILTTKITLCFWQGIQPPALFRDWTLWILSEGVDLATTRPIDEMLVICCDLGTVRSRFQAKSVLCRQDLTTLDDIEQRLILWKHQTCLSDERWSYRELQVSDSPHIWAGMLHVYSGLPVPPVWNTYRSMRIMVSRTQEHLTRELGILDEELASAEIRFETLRTQMMNDICASIPCLLGHSAPTFTSPCVLVTAYNTIWPLFHAGRCAIERVNRFIVDDMVPSSHEGEFPPGLASAVAQVAWILSRFDYISKVIGLRWAENVAAILEQDSRIFGKSAGRPSQSASEMSLKLI